MTLISCPECKREVSTEAKKCPGCGMPLQENFLEKAKKQVLEFNEKTNLSKKINKKFEEVKSSVDNDYKSGDFKKLLKNKYVIIGIIVFIILLIIIF